MADTDEMRDAGLEEGECSSDSGTEQVQNKIVILLDSVEFHLLPMMHIDSEDKVYEGEIHQLDQEVCIPVAVYPENDRQNILVTFSSHTSTGLLMSTISSKPAPFNLYAQPNNNLNYRSQIPQITINSEESNDDSDDGSPSPWKRQRNPLEKPCQHDELPNVPFVNPLLSGGSLSTRVTKRKNNIWGSVLTEQVLAQEVKTFGVNNKLVNMGGRDVESYDFTKAREDERPNLELNPNLDESKDDIFGGVVDLEKEVKKNENLNRKRKAKQRLGKKSYNQRQVHELGVSEQNSEVEIAEAITKGLSEPKVELFTRIVETLGKTTAIRLYYMTEKVEEAGGMMTNDGYRRRTPGGVYIQLLKSDNLVSKDQVEAIFKSDIEEWKKTLRNKRKVKKASRKKWKRQQKALDLDRPETPTPGEDLDVLNSLDSNNEFDATDLPERPATPEPKDDSSDGQGDDPGDEEEEDIALAIARAKAAILKKQRELASGISFGEGSGDNRRLPQDSNEAGDMEDVID